MKRSRRTLTVVSAAGLVIAGLVGCSSGGSGAEESEALTIWTWKQSEVAALEAVGEAWTKTSGIPLEVSVYTPDATYYSKITAAAKADGLPDILSVHPQNHDWRLAQAGIIQDLTDDFDADWQDQFLPGVMSALDLTQERIDNSGEDPSTTLKDLEPGHLYTVPYLAGTGGVVFARKSMLEAAGIDPTVVPETWEEWVSLIQTTVDNDPEKGGIATGMQNPRTGYLWLFRPLSYAYLGGDAFTGRQGRDADPAWDSAESIKTLELYDQMTDLWVPGVLAMAIDQADQAFASGNATWDLGGTFTLSSLATFGIDTDDVHMFPVPAPEGGAIDKISYIANPLVGASITSTTEHKEEAIDFLEFLTGEEGATIFSETAVDLPATNLPVENLTDPLLRQMVEMISTEEGAEAFAPYDTSADPAGAIATETATVLSGLIAKTTTPEKLAVEIDEMYAAAWDALK